MEGGAGVWGGSPQPLEANGGLDAKPSRQRQGVLGTPALGDFSMKITHFYAYFGQTSYFKAITHQLKAFEKQHKHTK